jgi:predicted transcriptional regulator
MQERNNEPASIERKKDQKIIYEIVKRLDNGDKRFESLEASLNLNTRATQQIAENTIGLIRLTTELEAGTRFLCRCALGIRFILKDVIEPYWKPSLIVFVVIFYITHDRTWPAWIDIALKAVKG